MQPSVHREDGQRGKIYDRENTNPFKMHASFMYKARQYAANFS